MFGYQLLPQIKELTESDLTYMMMSVPTVNNTSFSEKLQVVFQICYVYRDYVWEYCIDMKSAPAWTSGTTLQMKMRIAPDATGQLVYTFFAGATQFDSYYLDSEWTKGDYGLDATGSVDFSNFIVSSASSIKISISDCSKTNDDLINIIASALGIPTSNVIGIVRSTSGCTKKRVAETVTVTFIGTETLSSTEVANQFQASYGSGSNAGPGTTVPEQTILSAEPTTESAVSIPTVGIISVAAVGVTGVIVGIVIGAVAGAGLVAVGTGVAIVKLRKKPTKEPEPEPEPEKKKPKGATIDIFNFNPNDPQSITARSPAIKSPNNN